jgi:hypothetical protein
MASVGMAFLVGVSGAFGYRVGAQVAPQLQNAIVSLGNAAEQTIINLGTTAGSAVVSTAQKVTDTVAEELSHPAFRVALGSAYTITGSTLALVATGTIAATATTIFAIPIGSTVLAGFCLGWYEDYKKHN